MGDYVIFAIDNDADLHTNAKFLRHVDEQRAMMKMNGTMQLCIGSYKGKLERSYIMRWDDFMEHVADSGYVDKQESVLILRDGAYGKTYASLKYNDGSDDELNLGVLKPVTAYNAMLEAAWTYRPDLDQYYVCEAFTASDGPSDSNLAEMIADGLSKSLSETLLEAMNEGSH